MRIVLAICVGGAATLTPERIIQLEPGADGVTVTLQGYGWSNR